jgi:nucleoside-triphosphatase THEP1
MPLPRMRLAWGDGGIMATFTTWEAAKTQILNDFLNRNTSIAEYTIGDKSFKVRSIKELKELLELCDVMIGAEIGDMDTYVQFNRPGPGI